MNATMIDHATTLTDHERYRLLIEHSCDLICEIGYEGRERGRYLYLSPNYKSVLGYDPGELLHTSSFDLMHPDDLPDILPKFALDSATVSFRYRHKNGTWRWMEAAGQVFRNASGEKRACVISRDITERKKSEEALRLSERRYRQLVEQSPEAIMIHSDGIIVFATESFAKLMRIPSVENIIGKKVMDFIHPSYREIVGERIRQIHEGKQILPFLEQQMMRPDGTVVDVEGISRPLEYNGRLSIQVAVHDITDRKHMEEAMRESQAKWRSLVENVPDIIATIDPAGDILFINRLFPGYSRHQVLGASIYNFTPEAYLGEVRGALQRVFETGQTAHYEMAEQRGSGESAWYSGRVGPIKSGDEIVAATLILTDITEQKRAEESLRESETRFRQMAENIEEVFWMTDYPVQQGVIYVSPAYEKIWGRTSTSLYEDFASHMDAVHVDDRERVEAAFSLQVEGRYNEIYRIVRPDGSIRWVHDRAFPIRNEQGEIYRIVGHAEDITEQKKIEMQFFQSQKMDAFGKLAGGVAHDFNNLLTVISGYNEIVLNGFNANDPRRDCVEEIGKAAERASALTGQLLAFSRQQVLQPKIINLNDVVENVQKMLRRLIGEDVVLETGMAENLHTTRADPGQLENVLMNLAVNARDAMPHGGTLTIMTENVTVSDGNPNVPEGHYAVLRVADSGVGMTEQVKMQIFEPFFTTKPLGHGTGLGLATCYGIIKQSNGFITVDSKPGEGSTFNIYLPCISGTQEKAEHGGRTASLPRGSEKVLVVEDEMNVRKLAVSILQRLGYEVIEAINGEEAFRIAQAHLGQKIDLLITDVVMPQMGGRDLALWIRAMYPEAKILFTSGYPDRAFEKDDLLDENSAFMPKPYAPKVLAVQVRELLDKKPV
jgi:two-component system, cell cycle sensor histidine kinase and response regulator CckA